MQRSVCLVCYFCVWGDYVYILITCIYIHIYICRLAYVYVYCFDLCVLCISLCCTCLLNSHKRYCRVISAYFWNLLILLQASFLKDMLMMICPEFGKVIESQYFIEGQFTIVDWGVEFERDTTCFEGIKEIHISSGWKISMSCEILEKKMLYSFVFCTFEGNILHSTFHQCVKPTDTQLHLIRQYSCTPNVCKLTPKVNVSRNTHLD